MNTILVTGSDGFIGRNLIEALTRMPETSILRFDVTDSEDTLRRHLGAADAIFHVAGINRPEREEEFEEGNAALTARIVKHLAKRQPKPMIVLSSSIQAALDNAYGRSKRRAEEALEEYGAAAGKAAIFRLPNVFGKWSRPNYNSAVATFCHNIARGLEIKLTDPTRVVDLVYVDDVVKAFVGLLHEPRLAGTYRCTVGPVSTMTLGELANEICCLRDIRTGLMLPDMNDRFRRALYATYLSFLPTDDFSYRVAKREDHRGSLAELIKSHHFGQLFISRTKAGRVRGNHYHNTKVEKFCVVEGKAVIRFRQIHDGDVISYSVSGEEFRIVDIPPGYTHSIENVGAGDLVVLFWADELFNPGLPDTYAMDVMEPVNTQERS